MYIYLTGERIHSAGKSELLLRPPLISSIAIEPDGGEKTNAADSQPAHLGEVIKELCLDPLQLTVTAAAGGPGVSQRTLLALLMVARKFPPDTAIRLSKAFVRSPESWLHLQLQYDWAG